jgi:hypothetical protein
MGAVGMWLAALLLGRKAWRVERDRRRRLESTADRLEQLAARMAAAEERRAA